MASSRFYLVIGLVSLTSFGIASGCRDRSSADVAVGAQGTDGQACRPDGTCDAGLTCLTNLCVAAAPGTGGAGGEGNQTGTGGADASGGTSNTGGTSNGEAGSGTGGSGTGGSGTPQELDCHQEESYLICGNAGLSWTAAQAYCVSQGGALVKIDNGDENAALTELVTEDGSVWIGANDRDIEGDFRWTDGSPVVDGDASWADGQPNNSGQGENCAVLHAGGGDWNDVGCDETEFDGAGMTFVCELP